MSLGKRLAVVLVLALAALVFGVLAIGHVLNTTDAARERTAEVTAEAGAQALADAVAGQPGLSLREPVDPETRRLLQTTALSAVRPIANAAGGYCNRAGALLASTGKAGAPDRPSGKPARPLEPPPGLAHGHGLVPEVRAAVLDLCKEVHPGAAVHARLEHGRDVDLLSAVAVGDDGAAWFLWRVRTRTLGDLPAWPFEVVLLALAAAALAAVTVDAMLALRRGAAALRLTLVRLQSDLRAPVPRPRARELAEIAAGLESMASHLADARDRERTLSETLAGAQRLSALGRVVAGVAHEVRNPLAGMKLRLDLLDRSGELSVAASEDVAACLGEVARLNRLVESLLRASRSRVTTTEPLDLAALADERLALCAAPAEAAGVTLSRVGAGVAPGNRDAVAGALDNLLRNALEASPRGGAVRVHITEEAPELGQAPAPGLPVQVPAPDLPVHAPVTVLSVEDEGPGLPEDRVGELFEPFFTTKPEGTGLGLWMSRLLLEAGGAKVGYERVAGRTRMGITFPPRDATPGSAVETKADGHDPDR